MDRPGLDHARTKPETSRHTRQRRLAEVGQAGQERIGALAAYVSGEGLAAVVHARYLAGAGVGAVGTASAAIEEHVRRVDPSVRVVPSAPEPRASDTPAIALRDASAQAVAEGAWRALRDLRGALNMRGSGT
jgi:hypothetical protein